MEGAVPVQYSMHGPSTFPSTSENNSRNDYIASHTPSRRCFYTVQFNKMTTIRRLLLLVICSAVLSAATGETPKNCVYTIYVKTGSVIRAGTDSRISLILGDLSGRSVWVPDLEPWGLMEPSHSYYERGNLDVFSGLGPCIGPPLCWLNLTSDGSGDHHGWYCDYVEVTSARPHKPCSQTVFRVDQWLALDVPPFKLTAVINGCEEDDARSARRSEGGATLAEENARLFARE